MPRPREFDEATVLEQALLTFRRLGYEATSVSALCEATGLQKGSLYGAFGDKRSLFLRALRAYHAAVQAKYDAELGGEGSPRALLERFVLQVARNSCASGRIGCLSVNTSVELGAHDPEVAALTRTSETGLVATLQALLERGKAAGEWPPSLDARAAARFLQSAFAGMNVTAKGGAPREHLLGIARFIVASLDAPPPSGH